MMDKTYVAMQEGIRFFIYMINWTYKLLPISYMCFELLIMHNCPHRKNPYIHLFYALSH
jgi:hypothetical protein